MAKEVLPQQHDQPPRHRFWRLVAWFTGLLVCLGAVGSFARSRQHDRQFPGDALIRSWAHQLPWLRQDRAHVIGHFGAVKSVIPVDVLLLLLLGARKRIDMARFFGLSVAGASGLYLLTKPLVDRDRPALLERLKPRRKSSFPSGHAFVDMAFLGAVLHLLEGSRWRRFVQLLGVPWVALIGLSRVVEDEHYPSDVIFGWLASRLWVRAVKQLYGVHQPPEPQLPAHRP